MLNFKLTKPNWLVISILLLYWIGCSTISPALPDQVPSHWNIHGEIDRYDSKIVAIFIMPALPLGIYLLLMLLPNIDPWRENYTKFSASYHVMALAITGFLLITTCMPLLSALGYPVQPSIVFSILLPLLMIILGNYMGKLRPNFFIGIRLPWTLADEENWRKTHRFAGKAMVLGGLFAFTGVLFSPATAFIIVLSGTLIPFAASIIYSYSLYKAKFR